MKNQQRLLFCLLGFAGALALVDLTPKDIDGDCKGTFYSDLNSVFVDCFDSDMTFSSRREYFYDNPLIQECSTMSIA